MFKGRANTFYYNYLAGKGYDFNHIIYKLRYCRNKGIVYLPPVLMLPRQRRVNWLVTHKRECYGIKEIEIASFTTLTFYIQLI